MKKKMLVLIMAVKYSYNRLGDKMKLLVISWYLDDKLVMVRIVQFSWWRGELHRALVGKWRSRWLDGKTSEWGGLSKSHHSQASTGRDIAWQHVVCPTRMRLFGLMKLLLRPWASCHLCTWIQLYPNCTRTISSLLLGYKCVGLCIPLHESLYLWFDNVVRSFC
jgi:hypothetical protein